MRQLIAMTEGRGDPLLSVRAAQSDLNTSVRHAVIAAGSKADPKVKRELKAYLSQLKQAGARIRSVLR